MSNIAPAEQRSEVLAGYIVCCCVGVALPVIGAGVPTALTNSLVA